MKKGPLFASLLIAVALIGGAVLFTQRTSDTAGPAIHNVTVEGGTQIIEIGAKGGYTPKLTTAKADMPTVLRVKTDGTYDCSSAIRIPSLSFSKAMEPTGVTEISVRSEEHTSELQSR